jgi:hypothetical protein
MMTTEKISNSVKSLIYSHMMIADRSEEFV